MTFTSQQIEAIQNCVEWYYTKSTFKDVFVVGGYAGTGKSTIVNKIVEILRIPKNSVLFCALTGKAALVLRLKGLNANTIHKTFYAVYKSSKGIKFRLKKKLDFPPQLIIIDEFSMVDQKTLDDIRTFKIPVIGIGDPGQLPPIYGNNEFMRDSNGIDCFLTQIMRQSDESGILDLAYKSRNMLPIEYGVHKSCEVMDSSQFNRSPLDYDCVLCWKNSTRQTLNQYIRGLKKMNSIYPVKGDKLLCLRNNYNYEIDYNDVPIYMTNGLILICTEDSIVMDSGNNKYVQVVCKPDFSDQEQEFVLKCYPEVFEQYNSEEKLFIDPQEDDDGELVHLDFGYALTVHKSQGSEWGNVLILNEFKGSQALYAKWMYTAITRAKKSLTIVKK